MGANGFKGDNHKRGSLPGWEHRAPPWDTSRNKLASSVPVLWDEHVYDSNTKLRTFSLSIGKRNSSIFHFI